MCLCVNLSGIHVYKPYSYNKPYYIYIYIYVVGHIYIYSPYIYDYKL